MTSHLCGVTLDGINQYNNSTVLQTTSSLAYLVGSQCMTDARFLKGGGGTYKRESVADPEGVV